MLLTHSHAHTGPHTQVLNLEFITSRFYETWITYLTFFLKSSLFDNVFKQEFVRMYPPHAHIGNVKWMLSINHPRWNENSGSETFSKSLLWGSYKYWQSSISALSPPTLVSTCLDASKIKPCSRGQKLHTLVLFSWNKSGTESLKHWWEEVVNQFIWILKTR